MRSGRRCSGSTPTPGACPDSTWPSGSTPRPPGWEPAETAWREYRAAADYVSLLESEGFSVERGSGEMPTAFAATWGSGQPVIASYAEYDAVPGNSQQAIPRRAPREGSHPWAPGHTDPHSALGVGALAGVLAAKEAMSRAGLAGTLKLFGEPAEKVC